MAAVQRLNMGYNTDVIRNGIKGTIKAGGMLDFHDSIKTYLMTKYRFLRE